MAKGAIAASLVAGGLTAALGVCLPAIFLPESNLAPIVGFIFAPPAAIIGALMGAWIQWRVKSYLGSWLLGTLVGVATAVAMIVPFSTPESPASPATMALYVGLGILIFGTSGLMARKVSVSKA